MNQDGVRKGFDISQLNEFEGLLSVPLIASGGAGSSNDFFELFDKTKCSGGLAASIFHDDIISINEVKEDLLTKGINIRNI